MTFKNYTILILLIVYDFCYSYIIENSIFYKAPRLNIKFTNITLGMSIPLSRTKGSFSYQSYAGGVIAAVCQADQLNQKFYSTINFNGIINFAIQDYESDDPVGQYASFELLKNDLYYRETGYSLSKNNISNFASYIGSMSSGKNRINHGISAGYAMPFINPGTLNQFDPTDNFAIFSDVENRTMFSIRDTVVYSNINVIVNLMAAYNWTIAANIYENDVMGQSGQQSIENYQSKFSNPIFTCNSILTNNYLSDPEYYIKFCDCVDGINTLAVVNLFTSTQVGYEVILQLKKIVIHTENLFL